MIWVPWLCGQRQSWIKLRTKVSLQRSVLCPYQFLSFSHFLSQVICEAMPPPKAIEYKPSLFLKAWHVVYFNTPVLDVVGGTKDNNFLYLESVMDRFARHFDFL